MRRDISRHRLADHLLNCPGPPGALEVFVGTRPIEDGWVIVMLRIDGCTTEEQAAWFGGGVQSDLLDHLRHANQEEVPAEAVAAEWAIPAGAATWSIAVFVTLGSMLEALAMTDLLKAYAAPTPH